MPTRICMYVFTWAHVMYDPNTSTCETKVFPNFTWVGIFFPVWFSITRPAVRPIIAHAPLIASIWRLLYGHNIKLVKFIWIEEQGFIKVILLSFFPSVLIDKQGGRKMTWTSLTSAINDNNPNYVIQIQT